MKKILLAICLIISINAISQCTGNNNLQLEVRHWYWAVNKFGPGSDSLSLTRIRALRTQLIAANPADSTTLVTINNVPNEIIIFIYYNYVNNLTFGEYINMGSTDNERRTIFNNIRAISTPCVVSTVAVIDYLKSMIYWDGNREGKAILKDN